MTAPSSATTSAFGRVRVAAIQMVSAASVDANLQAAARLVAQAACEGARLVALPEYFCLLGRKDTDKLAIRERFGDGPIQRFLAETAARHGVWLLGGTLPLACDAPAKVRNASLLFSPEGRCAARYDKIHLFGLSRHGERFDEGATIQPGSTPAVADALGLRLGLTVCYDLRFPELFRRLVPCDLLLVPSAFTHGTGQSHWETLLRARAIENQCFLLAPAQGGTHENGRRTWGHSMLVDPWGEVLACLPEGEGVVAGEVDPARIAEVRAMLPALAHRAL
jgi:predicted amidohydrolase